MENKASVNRTGVASSKKLRISSATFYYLETKTEVARSQISRLITQFICRNVFMVILVSFFYSTFKHEYFLESSLSNVAYEYKHQVHRLSRIFWVRNWLRPKVSIFAVLKIQLFPLSSEQTQNHQHNCLCPLRHQHTFDFEGPKYPLYFCKHQHICHLWLGLKVIFSPQTVMNRFISLYFVCWPKCLVWLCLSGEQESGEQKSYRKRKSTWEQKSFSTWRRSKVQEQKSQDQIGWVSSG